MARALVRLGVRSLCLVEPDTLEAGNIGEMEGMRQADIGRHKADAVAEAIQAQAPYPDLQVTPLPISVVTLSALAAVKQVDLVCCCVDNPAARIIAQLLATLYLRPLLDIGTGIFYDGAPRRRGTEAAGTMATTPRRMGADVRLILPGHCLRCYGGIADFEAGRQRLQAGEIAPGSPGDWRLQRAGSLHALNAIAVGHAALLLLELATGRIARSVWLHLEFAEDGIPRLEHLPPPPDAACALCALGGQGDAAVGQLPMLLSQL